MTNTTVTNDATDVLRSAARVTDPPRVWPALVLVGLYWSVHVLISVTDPPMFVGFLAQMAALAVVTLGFSVLWLTNRRISR
jgi:hypothetical protein